MKIKIIPIFLTTLFFIISFLTLSDYGISWDETLHFRRGQAYLYYFLNGELDYHKLPNINLQGTSGDPKKIPQPRRSFYQNDEHNGKHMLEKDSGHPPINDELAALTNYIFFQKLGWMDDISSHHLFNILTASLLVFIVTSFALETFGLFTSIISFLSLVTYPLFWAESHFNIKDPPETAFFAATIWTFWKSLKRGNFLWLFAFMIFFALAMGTKFNILFLPFILIPYFFIYYRRFLSKPMESLKLIPKKYILVLLMGPLIIGLIFFGTWPYLWQNFPSNLQNIFGYYKEIGTNLRYQPDFFYILGFNTFPILWILFTTLPLVLILFILGIMSLFVKQGRQKMVGFLWLFWFLVPIARVSIPNTTIYGGIRQIMEFSPAMALIAGLGAWQVIQWIKASGKDKNLIYLFQVGMITLFLWPVVTLVKLHPYENVYFNFLIGGLSGAQEKNFPSWGNTFGSAYLQGTNWLNQNIEKGAKIALIQGTTANVPIINLRSDINYQNKNFSGIERGGEYLIELTFNDTSKDYYYAWEYVEKFLQPIYELKVDGVAILKIWKNNLNHTKPGFRYLPIQYNGLINVIKEENMLFIDLNEIVLLSKVTVKFKKEDNCSSLKNGFVETSLNRKDWYREKDIIPQSQVRREINLTDNTINYYFAGRRAQYIRFIFDSNKSCALNYYQVDIESLRNN